MSKGWISLDRSIRDHWIYQEDRVFSRYEAWIDLLLSANHSDNKVLIDGELQEVKRGTFITSIRKLQKRWKWSDSKVTKFFELLESEGMANRKSDTKKTVITIVKYEVYQHPELEKRRRNDSEATQKQNESGTEAEQKRTNNNVNNANNSNNDNKGLDSSPPTDIKNNINVHEEIQENFGRPLSPIEHETIGAWLTKDMYKPEVIRVALSEAVLNHAYSLKYIDRILLSWERKGIRSKSEALANIQKRRDERSVSEPKAPNGIEDLPEVPLYNWVEPEKENVT